MSGEEDRDRHPKPETAASREVKLVDSEFDGSCLTFLVFCELLGLRFSLEVHFTIIKMR